MPSPRERSFIHSPYSDLIPVYQRPLDFHPSVTSVEDKRYDAYNDLCYGMRPPLIRRAFDWRVFFVLLSYGFVLPAILFIHIWFPVNSKKIRSVSRNPGSIISGKDLDQELALSKLHLWFAHKCRHPGKHISSGTLLAGGNVPHPFIIFITCLFISYLYFGMLISFYFNSKSTYGLFPIIIYSIMWIAFCIHRCYEVEVYPTLDLNDHILTFQQRPVKFSDDRYTTLFSLCEGIRSRLHTMKKATGGYFLMYFFVALAFGCCPLYRYYRYHQHMYYADEFGISNGTELFSFIMCCIYEFVLAFGGLACLHSVVGPGLKRYEKVLREITCFINLEQCTQMGHLEFFLPLDYNQNIWNWLELRGYFSLQIASFFANIELIVVSMFIILIVILVSVFNAFLHQKDQTDHYRRYDIHGLWHSTFPELIILLLGVLFFLKRIVATSNSFEELQMEQVWNVERVIARHSMQATSHQNQNYDADMFRLKSQILANSLRLVEKNEIIPGIFNVSLKRFQYKALATILLSVGGSLLPQLLKNLYK